MSTDFFKTFTCPKPETFHKDGKFFTVIKNNWGDGPPSQVNMITEDSAMSEFKRLQKAFDQAVPLVKERVDANDVDLFLSYVKKQLPMAPLDPTVSRCFFEASLDSQMAGVPSATADDVLRWLSYYGVLSLWHRFFCPNEDETIFESDKKVDELDCHHCGQLHYWSACRREEMYAFNIDRTLREQENAGESTACGMANAMDRLEACEALAEACQVPYPQFWKHSTSDLLWLDLFWNHQHPEFDRYFEEAYEGTDIDCSLRMEKTVLLDAIKFVEDYGPIIGGWTAQDFATDFMKRL